MQDEDYKWFLEHIHEFQTRFGDMWLLISDKQVIACDYKFDTLLEYGYKTLGLGNFIIQKTFPETVNIFIDNR